MGRVMVGTIPGDEGMIKEVVIGFQTTAAALDANFRVLSPVEKAIFVVSAEVVFQALDTFASGVDIDLEAETSAGVESVLATYDTVAGGTPTAIDTAYAMTFIVDRTVIAGSFVQLRVDDDEDAACWGQLILRYIELEA